MKQISLLLLLILFVGCETPQVEPIDIPPADVAAAVVLADALNTSKLVDDPTDDGVDDNRPAIPCKQCRGAGTDGRVACPRCHGSGEEPSGAIPPKAKAPINQRPRVIYGAPSDGEQIVLTTATWCRSCKVVLRELIALQKTGRVTSDIYVIDHFHPFSQILSRNQSMVPILAKVTVMNGEPKEWQTYPSTSSLAADNPPSGTGLSR